jgi:AraC-like DNA-binding protein
MNELATDLKNTPKLEALASRFCVSARTFSRRLKSMGMSYRGIVEEVRRREAIDRLTNSDVSIAEISMSLGYADASNFSKAFKSWTGKSPKQYRLPKYQRVRRAS